MDEIYNHYEPMNESFRRYCHELEPVSHSELLDRKVNGGNGIDCGKGQKTYAECSIRDGNCGNAYEECKPCDTNHMTGDSLNNRTLSTYDAPLNQAYNFGGVSLQLFIFSFHKCVSLFTITNRTVQTYI
jgi:hypothetical protein